MKVRSVIAQMLSDVAYHLDDGKHAFPEDQGDALPNVLPSRSPPAAQSDYRFAAWQAQFQQRSMRFGPYVAIGAAGVLVFGLVKFWQIVTQHPADDKASVQAQATDVARKFEDAYRINTVKHELKGDTSAPSQQAPMKAAAPPAVESRARLVYFFPRGEQYFPSARPQFDAPRPQRSRSSQIMVVQDPLAILLHNYDWSQVRPQDDGASAGGSVRDPDSGGPTWRLGSIH